MDALIGFLVSAVKELRSMAAVTVLLLILMVWGLIRVINDDRTPIEWWQFISSRGADGKEYADPNKFGVMIGIIASTWVVTIIAWEGKLTQDYGPWLFFGWLVFLGGSEAFSKWFRQFIERRYATATPPGGKDETKTP